MSFNEKLSDLRWHVATTGHRDFAVTRTGITDGHPGMDARFRVPSPEPGTFDDVWIITCCGNRGDILEPVTCDFERRISERELAEAGHPEFAGAWGMGALVESIKLEPRREAPKAWSKVDALDIGDDEPV